MSALPLRLACRAGALADAIASAATTDDGIALDLVTPPVADEHGVGAADVASAAGDSPCAWW